MSAAEDDAVRMIAILAILDVLVEVNAKLLPARPDIPLLYESKVRYAIDSDEALHDALTTFQRGRGDAEDLVAWRLAELRLKGVIAKPLMRIIKNDKGLVFYHLLIEYPDGHTEDPSHILASQG